MSSLTTINSGDLITSSRAVINNNFAALNTDKIETSYIDTDTTLAANSDTKLPSQKAIKAYVDAAIVPNTTSSETTTGATHSLTTVAGQQVVVFAKGDLTGDSAANTITLSYNGVAKDNVIVRPSSSGHHDAWSLMYMEIPGAGTANITVARTAGVGNVGNVKIVVIKI